ncbi:MAG: archaellin/type IV pilin N-terminal domain-containing protein [Candidatus Bathyarchaeia archaeon]
MRTLKDKRAVSPVIATVILVAVAITVAVAVAYWMGGIAGMYTQHEQIEILSDYAPLINGAYWNVTLELKNTGSAECTLRSAFVNDVPIGNYVPEILWRYSKSGVSYSNVTSTGITVASGEEVTVYLIIEVPGSQSGLTYHFTSGTHININLHSAGGMDYPQLVELV